MCHRILITTAQRDRLYIGMVVVLALFIWRSHSSATHTVYRKFSGLLLTFSWRQSSYFTSPDIGRFLCKAANLCAYG
ncbi:hypothetical protein BDV24DRAFT_134053 [Aspergillus arachidicola]|uniref:Uncharacterized protein n=1 Tax=Aspergillus arachidicola TaxID=656916 RepID=A0A5N6Y503_9EURO|nr:hypothetical protein BDV24DRAFT_134053 [Aspergillus arachidicola]